MSKKGSCSRCGNEEHYVIVEKNANRFGVVGEVVRAVQCASCGKETKV